MKQKICINRCFGGFSLSIEAQKLYWNKLGKELFFYKPSTKGNLNSNDYVKVTNPKENDWGIITFTQDHGDTMIYDYNKEQGWWSYSDIERDDYALVAAVEELGEKASGRFSSLEVVEIPDNVVWEIDEYDGQESVHEVHRSW